MISIEKWKMEEEIQRYEDRYMGDSKKRIETEEEKNPNIKNEYETDYVKTFRWMKRNKEEHLRFIKDFQVPYTNNEAERGCRVVKAKKNVSFQFVSEAGGKAYVSILSLLQTADIKRERFRNAAQGLSIKMCKF